MNGEITSKRPVRTFRDLVAWQRGMALAKLIYRETRRLPRAEQFGLSSQMWRAAVSVPCNIAEGHGRQSRADYLKHLRIARGSLMEIDTQYQLATEIGLLPVSPELTQLIRETDRVLQALIRGLERK